ncbi:putative ribonuclease H-like domain-containing protein [Tanacetum coccineum]
MRILSVVRIKAYSRYGYDYLSEIILRRADFQEHTIAEKDFKNLYPSDFEDLNLLLLQGHLDHLPGSDMVSDKRMLSTAVKLWTRNLVIRQRVEDFQLGIESYQTQLNLTKPGWDATGYEFKHGYTIIESPQIVVFPVNNNERKIMRFNEIYKFSDGTLTRILEALDYRVKEFKVKRLNPGMNTRFWTEKDVTRSKEFIAAIERRLKTRRIYQNLECFVGGRVRDIDYRLLQRNGLHRDGDADTSFQQSQVHSHMDETSGILKRFITEIENLVDKKVKIIRYDNGTEFKNRVMTDYKLPTTFWAETVNTACYVQNRVLVVKPHNKTPYELFRGRTHVLSFKRPFGCHVSILNTLDYLGKFDGKLDEGFFVGYSMNSKDFRVYNIRTRKVKENLHIRFLEDKPIIAGDGPKWLFDIDVLTKSMNYVPVVAGTNSNDSVDVSLFDSSLKNVSNDETQPSNDDEKKDDEGVNKESGIADQKKSKNSTQGVNTAGPSINTEPDMFSFRDIATATHADFFGDEIEVDMGNITTTYPVPSTSNTRIHKDHSLDHVIGDVQSSVLTRRMTKTTNEQGFTSAVYEGKTHEDLHTCLLACFLS